MRTTLISLGLLCLFACSENKAARVGAGHYTFDRDKAPAAAQTGMMREVDLKLKDDGNYSLDAKNGDQKIASEGVWSLQGDKLTLSPKYIERGGEKVPNPEPLTGTYANGSIHLTVPPASAEITLLRKD